MGLFDRLLNLGGGRGDADASPALDPLADLVLDKLRVGYLVDFDDVTWTVTAHHRYRFSEGDEAEEWELTDNATRRYLTRETGDGVYWSLSKKIALGAIDTDVRGPILAGDEPPARIVYRGATLFLDESDGGRFFEDAGPGRPRGEGKPFIAWTYIDEEDTVFLNVEQWGEREIEAAHGREVEEYQFTNILPGDSR
ncbi:MAG: DUF4178 domain-containing protein [Acidobacteriota bacterium]